MEFFLLVVKNDIPDGQVVMTKYMDFVLPPEGARWFYNWRPHARSTTSSSTCESWSGTSRRATENRS